MIARVLTNPMSTKQLVVLGLDVHANDVQLRTAGRRQVLVDDVAPRGHQDDFALDFLVLEDFAGDMVAQQRMIRIDGDLAAGFPGNRLLHRLLVHLGEAKVLQEDRRRGQGNYRFTPLEISLRHQIAHALAQKAQARIHVVADVEGNIGRGGGDQPRLIVDPGDLRDLHAVGAEVDADGIRFGPEPFLYECKHGLTAPLQCPQDESDVRYPAAGGKPGKQRGMRGRCNAGASSRFFCMYRRVRSQGLGGRPHGRRRLARQNSPDR
jgi:hypothetical protein